MTGSMASSTIEVLTRIWQRVLRCSPISADDNFFDLGGTPSSAQTLFTEIAEVSGREFPPSTICYAPTITALAIILEQPIRRPLAPLVQLRPGTGNFEELPIFLTHGIGSSAIDLVKLARAIDTDQPVYGLPFRGMDGIEKPLDRIEDMAQWFLDAVEKIQPHGPYFLIGYSLGGLITLEMARRLAAAHQKIALLAMLDSYPDLHYLSVGQQARLRLRLAKMRASSTVRRALRQFLPRTLPPETSVRGQPPKSSFIRILENVSESSYVAWRNYIPSFYNGKINFVRAEVSTYFPADPVPVWAHLANTLEVEPIPGPHLDMLTTNSAKLAGILSRYLKEATPASRPAGNERSCS
jgi:thioesterase domain-containing protein